MSNFFRRHRPSLTAPAEIYASSLSIYDWGYALWFPEPHNTGEPQIGDVGYINKGAFVRFFNLNPSSKHGVTWWNSRKSFTPFEPTTPPPEGVFDTPESRENALLPGHYRSHGVDFSEVSGTVNV